MEQWVKDLRESIVKPEDLEKHLGVPSEEVRKIIGAHTLSRKIDLTLWDSDEYYRMESKDPKLADKLNRGITMWGSSW